MKYILISLATLLVLNSCTQPSKYVGVWYCGAEHYPQLKGFDNAEYQNIISFLNLQNSGRFTLSGSARLAGTWKEDSNGIQLNNETRQMIPDGKVENFQSTLHLSIDSARNQLLLTHFDSMSIRTYTCIYNRVSPLIDSGLKNRLCGASWELQIPSENNKTYFFCKNQLLYEMSSIDSVPKLTDSFIWTIKKIGQYQIISPQRTMISYPYLLLKGSTQDQLSLFFSSSIYDYVYDDKPVSDTCLYKERSAKLVKRKSLSDKKYVELHNHLMHTRWDSKIINMKEGYYQLSLELHTDSIHLKILGRYNCKKFDYNIAGKWYLHASGDLIYYNCSPEKNDYINCRAFYINQLNPKVLSVSMWMNTQPDFSGNSINIINQELYRVLY